MDEEGLDALRRAVAALPDDLDLRVHLARALQSLGRRDEAISAAASILVSSPTHEAARQMLLTLLVGQPEPGVAQPSISRGIAGSTPEPAAFNWSAAEREMDDIRVAATAEDNALSVAERRKPITLKDVAGMSDVKKRLEAAFLAPMRNPKLRQLYAKSLRGGLLLYGPPGCGKTFIARALAGELGASFLPVGISDILDPYTGESERNIHAFFQEARRQSPCVLFFDEVDTLGQRRTSVRGGTFRSVVNQLLTELDGVADENDGVFVLAATNQPWEVDPALRRPGRFDRTLLVLPPDAKAREAIFALNLEGRPVESISLAALARSSEGLSGADIAFVCENAAEVALMASIEAGEPHPITMVDLQNALAGTRPSTTAWLDAARNVVMFGDDGTYTDLKAYMKRVKRL